MVGPPPLATDHKSMVYIVYGGWRVPQKTCNICPAVNREETVRVPSLTTPRPSQGPRPSVRAGPTDVLKAHDCDVCRIMYAVDPKRHITKRKKEEKYPGLFDPKVQMNRFLVCYGM